MMRTVKYLLALTFYSLLSCNEIVNDNYTAQVLSTTKNDQEHPGKDLMETYCYSCHGPNASMDTRIGPPMVAIKRHYISEGTTKSEFQGAIWIWIQDPVEENARMYGAVRRFGVMPRQQFSKEDIFAISEYLFDADIPEPSWFKKHHRRGHGQGVH